MGFRFTRSRSHPQRIAFVTTVTPREAESRGKKLRYLKGILRLRFASLRMTIRAVVARAGFAVGERDNLLK